MKKSIILFFALAMLTQPAGASTNEAIYKMCKPYADNGFDLKSPRAEMCFGYFAGVAHTSLIVCEHARSLIKGLEEREQPLDRDTIDVVTGTLQMFAYDHGADYGDEDTMPINSQVQSFLNWIEENPTELSTTPSPRNWLQDYRCKIDLNQ